MKALILNSGRGTRMGDETKEHPKCMTRLEGEETILSRQLKQLKKMGIRDVVITTGYHNGMLEDYAKTVAEDMNVTYVFNELYSTTNYIYSIYVARKYLQDDIVFMHGDLVFEDNVLEQVLACKNSCMVVDSTLSLPEKDFKAVVKEDTIVKVGIEFFEDAVAAQPLYKLNQQDWKVWLDAIVTFCESKQVTCYAENALNEVSDQCNILPYDVKGMLCAEIDTMEDRENVLKKMK